MGMYNEVYCRCPKCGGLGYMQISQIVLGFGEFNIQDRTTLEDLTSDQLEQLHEEVSEEQFECQSCNAQFNPLTNKSETKNDDINRLFGI